MINLWKSLLVSPVVFGVMLVVSTAAAIAEEKTPEVTSVAQSLAISPKISTMALNQAIEIKAPGNPNLIAENLTNQQVTPISSVTETSSVTISQDSQSVDSDSALAQVTSVSQLSDVQPTDWAFQALQSLVERYGCIAGYPDSTFRGNRALTRYEFAAGVNACLDRVNELITTATSNLATREDLATLQRLQEEFAAELATLRGRVDSVEAVTAELEANQFSTTTKLEGEVIFGVAGIVAGDNIAGEDLDDSTVLADRVRLNFESSFTGRDALEIELETGNFPGFGTVTGTAEGELAYAVDEGNDLFVEALLYAFTIGESTEIILAANAVGADDFVDTVNFLDSTLR